MWLIEVRRRATAAAWVFGALLVPALAAAQSDEQRAAARSLATEGAAAFNQGRYKDAVDMFNKAESLVHAPPHLLFLARADAKLGRYVRARESYLKILKETLPANAPQAFRDAQTAAEQEVKGVEPHIGRLTVNVEGGAGATDIVVMLDGTALSSVLIGVPQPIDPGEHRVEAGATGFRAPSEPVTLADGEKKTVVLKLEPAPGAASLAPVAAAAPAAAQAAPPPPPENTPTKDQGAAEPASDKSGLRIGSYVAFGVGVAGLAAGTVFTLQSSSKRKDADAKFEECGGDAGCTADNPLSNEVNSLDDDARSAKTLGIVGFVVGGVGVAAGVTLFILSSGGDSAEKAGVTPFVGLGSAGLRGRF